MPHEGLLLFPAELPASTLGRLCVGNGPTALQIVEIRRRPPQPPKRTVAPSQFLTLGCQLGATALRVRASGAVVGRVHGLKCRAVPLLRSDRRPTCGADGRKEGMPPDENALYLLYAFSSLIFDWTHGLDGLPKAA